MDSVELWTKSLQMLDDWLQKLNTDPQLQRDLIIGLTKWDQVAAQEGMETKSLAAQEQDALGWDLLLEGRASKQWRLQQEKHWKMYKSRKSSKWWTTELFKKLMEISWDMWQHRNKALHEEPQNRALILEQDINNQVTKTYQLGPGAFITGATLMKRPLPDLLQLPVAYKRHWLESAKIAKARQDKQREGPYYSKCRQMESWVIRTPKTKK